MPIWKANRRKGGREWNGRRAVMERAERRRRVRSMKGSRRAEGEGGGGVGGERIGSGGRD